MFKGKYFDASFNLFSKCFVQFFKAFRSNKIDLSLCVGRKWNPTVMRRCKMKCPAATMTLELTLIWHPYVHIYSPQINIFFRKTKYNCYLKAKGKVETAKIRIFNAGCDLIGKDWIYIRSQRVQVWFESLQYNLLIQIYFRVNLLTLQLIAIHTVLLDVMKLDNAIRWVKQGLVTQKTAMAPSESIHWSHCHRPPHILWCNFKTR